MALAQGCTRPCDHAYVTNSYAQEAVGMVVSTAEPTETTSGCGRFTRTSLDQDSAGSGCTESEAPEAADTGGSGGNRLGLP